ncbi:MAG: hypothetical protein KTR31_23140 [Myxococcales bacterium]|nr:hypothetical protein [Myxococcales bacterium]
MTLRPFVVAALLIVAVLLVGALLANERILDPDESPELEKFDEPLRGLQYLPGNRRGNFQAMGMEFEMAEATASHIHRFQGQAPRFEALLDEHAAELVDVFCPSDLPQPYGALAYLVTQENDQRRVLDADLLTRFERQLWYDDTGLVPALHDRFERTENRKGQATLMAVSAALLGREEDALTGRSPWSSSLLGSWGFARLIGQEPQVQRVTIEYFALMHWLTELANTRDGICS